MFAKRAALPTNWLIVAGVFVFLVAWFGFKTADKDPQAPVPESAALLTQEAKKSLATVTNSDEEVTRVNETSRFSSNQITDSWPPQPLGLSGVSAVEVTVEPDRATRTVTNKFGQQIIAPAAREIAESSDSVRVLLGNRYEFIQERPKTAKWTKEHLGDEVIFFSYDQNLTVMATVEQGQVVDVQGILPTEYQPPLAPAEKARASGIAREFWRLTGDLRIDDLEAFTILTYDGEERHAVRMAYVTFHYTSTINPELLTWVDLTNERIDRSLIQRSEAGQ